MTIDSKFQNDIMDIFELDLIYENNPINRVVVKPQVENKNIRLQNLEKEIKNIKNCKLKDNANKLVFSDGDIDSKIMIVGEGPGQKEDEIGKPFVGEAGLLLNKMLKSIQLPIHSIAHGRAGDKGDVSNVSLIAYNEFGWKHIQTNTIKYLTYTKIYKMLGYNKNTKNT